MNNYNPAFTGINGQVNAGGMNNYLQYQQQQLQAQMRQLQQQATLQQDAQTAAQALQEAQNRYSQIVGQMGGSNYMGGSIGYGGAGVIGYPITSPVGGYGRPSLTPTRQ